MKRTPLHDTHLALEAKLVDFGGWHMPVQYGPILDEARCVRERAGLFDLGHMGRVNVTGPDAVKYLDRLATNYVAKIPTNSIRYSLFCKENGAPIDDLLVYKGKDDVYLVVNASNTDVVLEWMRSHSDGFDIAIDDQTAATTMIALQGPAALDVLKQVTQDTDLDALGYYKFTFGTVCGLKNTRISRTGYTGENGFELYFANSDARKVWDGLMTAGKSAGVQPIGLGARDTLRLEAGMPLYGHEIDADHDPIEAGLAFGVSFEEAKGDWIGRAALAKTAAAPKRALVGFTTDGKRVPRQGYALMRGDETLGEVCSGAVSPTLDTNIGTGYVPVELAVPGTELEMDIRGKRQSVRVCDMPFYSRTRKKN